MSDILISVVIPTRNHKPLITRLLRSITSQSISPSRYEIIVVDDGSTDGTQEFLREAKLPCALEVLHGDRVGPPRARNSGAERARASIVAFMDDDVVLRGDCFERAVRYFDDPSVGVVETNLLIEGSDRPLQREASAQGFVTAAIFFRKDSLAAIDGFDPDFFDPATGNFFRDDSDLGFRVVKAGYRTLKPDDVVAWHPVLFPTVKSSFAHARRYMFDPLLYRKHPKLFRRYVERKKVGPFSFGRPMHYSCLFYLLCLVAAIVALAMNWPWIALAGVIFAAAFLTLVRYKFQGSGAVRVWRVKETLAYGVLPFWYVYWFLRGCMKFGGWKAIL